MNLLLLVAGHPVYLPNRGGLALELNGRHTSTTLYDDALVITKFPRVRHPVLERNLCPCFLVDKTYNFPCFRLPVLSMYFCNRLPEHLRFPTELVIYR